MRILYIDIDSLRPDHLGCYGYHRNTSPNIDRIAAQGIRFNNCYTPDAPCLPSRTAFYTGRFGIKTGVVGHGGTAADPVLDGPSRGFKDTIENTSLPARLQQAGYHTAQISPFGQRHAARQFYAGFNEIHNTGKEGMESAEVVTPIVLKWIHDNGSRDNWFLHVNFWDPHTPYRTPEDYPNHFKNDPLPDWLTDEVLEQHMQAVGPHSARELEMFTNVPEFPDCPKQPSEICDREDLRAVIDGYDSGVRYVDDQVGVILSHLEAAGIAEDVAIIISADHGENLGELGIYAEHGTADQITCRVPMIIRWPGLQRFAGSERDALHYNLDFAPTLCELLGIQGSDNWDGRSFASSLIDEKDEGWEELVISQCAHVCQRSVRFGRWLYIHTWHDGYHLFPREMLFDLDADPHEQFDLAKEYPEVCRDAIVRLFNWTNQQLASSHHKSDPMWTVLREGGPFHARDDDHETLTQYLTRLRVTGRIDQLERLKERHPHLRTLD